MVIDFRKLDLSDRDWFTERVMKENCPSDVLNFGSSYTWSGLYKQEICDFNGRTISKYDYGYPPIFAYPIGEGELAPAIRAMKEYCDENAHPLKILGVTDYQKQRLEAEFPGSFEFCENRDSEEYVYLASRLSTYSGKALHGKKNHCNRFEAEHKWEFKPLTTELIPQCIEMLDRWEKDNAGRLSEDQSFEYDALICTFENYEKLGMDGGVLFADGNIVGFTAGEFASPDTFDVHFEKAQHDMNGAYPMVCREFTRMLMQKYPNLVYMNREEDLGLEALRKSKLSYKPEYLLRKYTARWIDE